MKKRKICEQYYRVEEKTLQQDLSEITCQIVADKNNLD